MIIKDTFSKLTNISKLSGCIAFFTNEKTEITHLRKYLNSSDHKNLTVLLKNKNKKKGLLSFDLNPNQKIILISLKKNQKSNETEKNGAMLTDFLKGEGAKVIHIVSDTITLNLKPDAIYEFLHGMSLKAYSFDRYKSKKDSNTLKVNVITLDSLELNPSYLKIHTEGTEASILKGGISTIKKHKPLIAYSVYHRREGFYEDIAEIMRLFAGYNWFFRLHSFHGTGAFVYAIPTEG